MTSDEPLTHLDDHGRVRMVDVSDKEASTRTARAFCKVLLSSGTRKKLASGDAPKGNALECARIAGIMAAKKTWELIPMCHPLWLDHVSVDFSIPDNEDAVEIRSQARIRARTGVEMEALVAVTVAALTLYDMLKASDKTMVITEARLVEKTGGKSGVFRHPRDGGQGDRP